MIADDILRAQLAPHRSTRATFRRSAPSTKARCATTTPRTAQRIIVVTDRLSAFDVVLGTIPFKGQVLNQLAAHWFDETQGDRAQPRHRRSRPGRHARDRVPPLPVEMVMRGYLTGVTSTSIWRNYEAGARTFCGAHAARRHEEERAAAAARCSRRRRRRRRAATTRTCRAAQLARARPRRRADVRRSSPRCASSCSRSGRSAPPSAGSSSSTPSTRSGATPDGKHRLHRRDPHARLVALLVRRRLRGSGCRAAKSRAALDKEYVRRWYVDAAATTATGTPPPIPDERARRSGASATSPPTSR